MNLDFTPDELAFQHDVRAFLADHLPPHIVAATASNSSVFVDKDIALEWQAILADKGWANTYLAGADFQAQLKKDIDSTSAILKEIGLVK